VARWVRKLDIGGVCEVMVVTEWLKDRTVPIYPAWVHGVTETFEAHIIRS